MEIRLAASIELLARLAAEIRRLTALLVEQGVAAEQLTLFVSVLNDRLSQRVIEIVRKRHQWERIGWCWLAFGSEGRLEQTFSSDQDNGLLFEAHEGGSAAATRSTLLAFAREVNQALDVCGFPLCKGNVMASNPELCLSLDEWKAKMGGWLGNPEPKALLDATICFDFRPLSGDASLAQALREWLSPHARARPAFLRLMATNALQARPPLGVLGDFITEEAGAVNLKLYGVRPFVDAARVYALAFGLAQTGTAERLRAATGDLRMLRSRWRRSSTPFSSSKSYGCGSRRGQEASRRSARTRSIQPRSTPSSAAASRRPSGRAASCSNGWRSTTTFDIAISRLFLGIVQCTSGGPQFAFR